MVYLEQYEYQFDYNRMLYVNMKDKKIFPYETLLNHSPQWVLKHIKAKNTGWAWYGQPITDKFKQGLVEELEVRFNGKDNK